jgi:hypothetical protein
VSTSSADVLSRIRGLLGLTSDDVDPESSTPSLEALLRRTRRQLLECARYLGLTGIRRLTKSALAARFLHALQAMIGSGAPAAPESTHRPHKFDLGQPPETPVEVEHIPWGYGQDRVTGMVADPERLYVYWELTDEAIEHARGGLGPGGRDAWLNLRVYDVTDRIFDGTNAHSYFDHAVSRSDRQWFFFIGKPASTTVVELGLKSHEGYFVRIARSGRADFPRREPVSSGGVEWLTVREATGEIREQATDVCPPTAFPSRVGLTARVEPVRAWDIRRTHAGADGEWILRDESFGAEWAAEYRIEWEGPIIRITWEGGPSPYPIEPPPYVEEHHAGGAVIVRSVDGRTHIVYGPWQVVIWGLGARAERTVQAVWEIHRSWLAHAGAAVQPAAVTGRAPGSSEQLVRGASDLRLGGASELYRFGASELRYLGASEIIYAGASEWRRAGASERLHAGASEHHLGAGERRRESWLGYPEEGARTAGKTRAATQ